MRYFVAAIVSVLFAAGPARTGDECPKDPAARKAVEKALTFLKQQQHENGTWSSGRGPANPGVNGLCVRAFLSAGHVPGEEAFGATIEKGIRAILKAQQDNGLIASDNNHEMYHHGIATLMLAEAALVTKKPLRDDVRRGLDKAISVILKAQRKEGVHKGGWRYNVNGTDSDMSVTGWQVMALATAKKVGCDVPSEAIDRAIEYVKRCQDSSSGGFRYIPSGRVTVGCTGSGLQVLEACAKDWGRSEARPKAVDYLLKTPPRWGSEQCSYNLYHGSEAMARVGGRSWDDYREAMHKALLPKQAESGGWFADDAVGRIYGYNYTTAMAVLALTAECNSRPATQGGKEPAEKSK